MIASITACLQQQQQQQFRDLFETLRFWNPRARRTSATAAALLF